jgi:S1-C subfamily serine protease
MIEEEKISSVRKSVVAIGLADSDGQKPLVYQGKPMVEGTGFLVAKRGYIMTASHVLHRCKSHQSSIGGNPKIGFSV